MSERSERRVRCSEATRRQVLEQPKSTIDFDDIINSGKILICNFSKGLIGEDTSSLFGITVLAKLQLASLRRARISQDSRKHFYLYVDEFQNFATASFVQMLSEARKYKMFMIMAEQSTSQQKDQQILINLSSVEYTKAILPYLKNSTVITPRFLTVEPKTKEPKFVVVHAKIARGAFASWLVKERIEDPKRLKEFTDLGYKYDPGQSTTNEPAYVADKFGGLGLSLRLTKH